MMNLLEATSMLNLFIPTKYTIFVDKRLRMTNYGTYRKEAVQEYSISLVHEQDCKLFRGDDLEELVHSVLKSHA